MSDNIVTLPPPKVSKAKSKAPTANGHAAGHAAAPLQNGGTASWRGRLICSKSGNPVDCIENVRGVLLEDPCFAGLIHHDEMRARTVVGSLPWRTSVRLRDWVDRDGIDLAAWCQRHGLIVKPTTCDAAVASVAAAFPVHPLRDRLNGLAWDNVERLDGWLTDYLGVEKGAYSATVGRKWMIQAVARVMRPGCKADHTLIFEGLQGPGKSTVCETLALDPEWFADGIADLGTKDSAQDLQGKWIVELGELSAVRRGEVERVKAFLTRKSDHYRPSYGRHSQDFPRQCVFAGSTNATAYLTDPTGNRHFWPIKVGLVDHAALRLDVEQLWAEAVAAFRAGERWWLDPADELAAADEQDRRVIGDPWEDLVIDAAVRIHSGAAFKKLGGMGLQSRQPKPLHRRRPFSRAMAKWRPGSRARAREGTAGGTGWKPSPRPARTCRQSGQTGTPGFRPNLLRRKPCKVEVAAVRELATGSLPNWARRVGRCVG